MTPSRAQYAFSDGTGIPEARVAVSSFPTPNEKGGQGSQFVNRFPTPMKDEQMHDEPLERLPTSTIYENIESASVVCLALF